MRPEGGCYCRECCISLHDVHNTTPAFSSVAVVRCRRPTSDGFSAKYSRKHVWSLSDIPRHSSRSPQKYDISSLLFVKTSYHCKRLIQGTRSVNSPVPKRAVSHPQGQVTTTANRVRLFPDRSGEHEGLQTAPSWDGTPTNQFSRRSGACWLAKLSKRLSLCKTEAGEVRKASGRGLRIAACPWDIG